VTGKPAAVIVSFVESYTIDPRFQAAIAPKGTDVAEDLEKNFLDNIRAFRWVVHQAVDEIVDRLLKSIDQDFVGLLLAGPQSLNEQLVGLSGGGA
jgi:hypothetical protein